MELRLAVAKGAAAKGSDFLVLTKFCPWRICSFKQRRMTSEIQLQASSVELATTLDSLSTSLATYLGYLGLRHGSFSANGEVSRANLARDFLTIVNGLAYLPANTIAIEIISALDALLAAHNSWNNFYNEPSPARLLQSFVPASGNIPDNVSGKYVKILTMCHIGNGYGVSSSAEPIHNILINRWQDSQISRFIKLTRDSEIASRLQFSSCQTRYQRLASQLVDQATHPNVKLALEFIRDFLTEKLDRIGNNSRFQTILKTVKR